MFRGTLWRGVVLALLMGGAIGGAASQRLSTTFFDALTDPAIGYAKRPVSDPVSQLNRRITEGQVHLTLDGGPNGYLRSLLDALDIPIESQLAIFSKTSVQAGIISPENPRALFFNDSVVVGIVHGGFLELVAQDPQQGVIFFTLDQQPAATPRPERADRCLNCHYSYSTVGVPGLLVRSVYPAPGGEAIFQLGNETSDHTSPFEERWGGWYVTGEAGALRHRGNTVVTNAKPRVMVPNEAPVLARLGGQLEAAAHLTPYSDIVALMVFNHQARMMNLLTRVGWEVRFAGAQGRSNLPALLRDSANEFVDYLLFVDEAPLAGPIHGTSGFAEKFAARGPRDAKGRSLRQFDLERRLMRYPCSYMIYSAAFDALPADAKVAIYRRMWEILSGQERDAKYGRLSVADRQAIIEILRATKKDLPAFFT